MFYLRRRLHLPTGMCSGYVPACLQCLQHLLPVPHSTLIFIRAQLGTEVLGQTMFNFLLSAHSGKVGPNDHTPIEVDRRCNRVVALCRFWAEACSHKQGRHFNWFNATTHGHPLAGTIVCETCYSKKESLPVKQINLRLDYNEL